MKLPIVSLIFIFSCVSLAQPASSPSQSGIMRVDGGTFQMGSTTGGAHEAPVHSVTVSGFYIDKTEITFERWTDVRNWALTHGYADLPEGKNGQNGTMNHPVTEVTWYDIVKWCNARSEKEGLTPVYYATKKFDAVYREGIIDLGEEVKWTANGYRLPTEAEWEFAARGGIRTKGYTFSGGNALVDVAWYSLNAGDTTHAVGTKPANELGIFDMSGNVAEWCWDWYGDYGASPQTDPKGPASGTYRLNRGGSFGGDADYCRLTFRDNVYGPEGCSGGIGFRCVRK